jgi:signal peptidase I
MRTFTKIAVRSVLILILVCVLFVIAVRSLFIVSPMRTGSMQPLIATNDIVVATKLFHTSSLRSGDLVVADIPIPDGSHILTVRKIEQQTNTPAGQFYLQAASTNGLDSHFFGALPASAIRGRVIWIYRGS